MHPEAYEWVSRFATDEAISVLDIGGRNINGSVRPLFPNASYTVLDIRKDQGVDIIADAAVWHPYPRRWDLVLCCETLEHAPAWREICVTACRALRPGGRLVATMAHTGRPAHSGIDGGPVLHPGEQYQGIDPAALREALEAAGFADIEIDVRPSPADVRAVATRPA